MTKAIFQSGDQIGSYLIDEFNGQNLKGENYWWVKTETGELKSVPEKKLRAQLAKADWTPEKIRSLSSKAYDELVEEIGAETVDEILGSTTKKSALEVTVQREISAKWFQAHPQIPLTKANSKLFDDYLAKMPSPTFTSKDFDLAFGELFTKLELNPLAAGIQGHGEAIRGETALQKFTATQVQQLQKSFPVATKPKNYDRSNVDEAIAEIGDISPTADAFVDNLKTLDKSLGKPEQIPPLMMEARRQLWSSFFQLHPSLQPSPDLQQALITVCEENRMPMQLQSLDLALEILVEKDSLVVQRQESNVKTYNGARWVTGTPRTQNPVPQYDPTETVEITLAELNSMDSKTYGQKVLNPAFRAAVDTLMQKVGQAR